MKKLISFDFDSTLDNHFIQEYALELKKRGFEIMVCTSRFEPYFVHEYKHIEWDSADIFTVCESLDIKKVIFTNMRDKWLVLKDHDILFHLDDDKIEVMMLQENNINAVLYEENWKENCEKIIKENNI
jgi:hypothetical protein